MRVLGLAMLLVINCQTLMATDFHKQVLARYRSIVAKESNKNSISSPSEPKALEVWQNSIGIKFIYVPEGSYHMGMANDLDNNRRHKVQISKGFWLSETEVRQRDWQKVMHYNPAFQKGLDLPVENVSWHDVQKFIKKLNVIEGVFKYRLPSEAEWEYACKAGIQTDRYGPLHDIAWFIENSDDATNNVALKKPNRWGFFDMLGNVWEWCDDWHDKDYYLDSPIRDPVGPIDGKTKIFRGGSCTFPKKGCRASFRYWCAPTYISGDLGFRLLREK